MSDKQGEQGPLLPKPVRPSYHFRCVNRDCIRYLRNTPIVGSIPLTAVRCEKCGQPMPFFLDRDQRIRQRA